MLQIKHYFELQVSYALRLIFVCNLATMKHMLEHVMHAQSQKYAASRLGTVQVLLNTGWCAKQAEPTVSKYPDAIHTRLIANLTQRDIAWRGHRSPNASPLPGVSPHPLVPPHTSEVHCHSLQPLLVLGRQQVGPCLPERLVSIEALLL